MTALPSTPADAGAGDPAPFDTLAALFEAAARRHPDAPAVAAGEARLTYAQLDARAEALAGALAARGAGPETPVAVFLERGVELPAALLAVWKAGAACVPLDTAYPDERLAWMLADAGARLVVTRARLADRLPPALPRLLADALPEGGAPGPRRALPGPDALAYVTYTSGSTGRPKGVLSTHRGACAFLRALADFGLGPGDTVLQLASPAFDASVRDLVGPLTLGARVVLPGAGQAGDPRALLSLAAEERVTALLAVVPSLLRALAAAAEPGRVPLRLLLLSGEALSGADCRRARAAFGAEARIVNQYGPTECTMTTTRGEVPADGPAGEGIMSLGAPLPYARVHVLAGVDPVPAGAAGELCIGGAGVTRGYHGRPALTAASFVPDPFAGVPGARMYRTGDLGRAGAAGLEFLGRTDHQLKVRGVRVEPQEVEAALREHPCVHDAAVAPFVRDGETALAAYLVAAPGRALPSPAALRSALAARLPAALVPARFVSLPALPRTPNGKLDRAALPAVDAGAPTETLLAADAGPAVEAEGGAEGADAVEARMAGIWARALGVERVGVDQGFFELGGDSLLAARLAVRVWETWGVEVPVRAVFEESVAALAARVRAAPAAPLAPLGGRAGEGPPPLSFAQERLWFLDRLEQGSAFYNMGRVFRLRGPVDEAALGAALDALARRHEGLRTVFPEVDGRGVQEVRPDGRLPLRVEDLSGAADPEGEGAARVRADAGAPFDLARGPLARALLLRLAPGEHLFALTLHHTVTDDWSMGVLLRELGVLYDAAREGRAPDLAPLPARYADFAAWQRGHARGPAVARQLDGWRRRLAGAPPALELPGDFPRPAVERFRGAQLRLRLSRALADALAARARAAGATPFMALLAGFKALLLRYTGQEDLVVGSPVAGRGRSDVEGVVGFFANTLVLRTSLAGDPALGEVLARVRRTALEALDHQDVPFELLVEALGVERSATRNPLFQVMLAMENVPSRGLALGGTRAEPLPAETGTAKFDLTVFAAEDAEGISLLAEYSTDLFRPETVARLLDGYARMLRALADAPETPVSRVPLAATAEAGVAGPEAPGGPPSGCLHHRFAEQARRTPDAEAVRFEGRSLTYAALWARACRLAHHLRARGVGPDARVGVHLERGPEMAVALLGVAAAGGAVVALDPAYPSARLRQVCADARLRVLLTDAAGDGALDGAAPVTVRMDADAAEIEGHPSTPPAVAVDGSHLLYVIYTSGSTGRPKGVGVTHDAFLNLLEWQLRHPRLGRPAVTLQFATFGFCVSFQEMYGTWCAGGTVVLLPEARRAELDGLVERVRAEGVERLFLPFAALKHLALLGVDGERVPGLRDVVTAGEPLQVTDALRAWFAGADGCALHNQYGASETHVVAACTLEGDPAAWPLHPPAGRPVDHVRLYVVDRRGHPVPPGVPGELWAGGACLPRGYLGDPRLTAERLVPDPFGARPGERLYRTGDLARLRDDGVVEVLGRVDQQLKIRGYRVEPGEVEAALRRCPGVRDAAVVPVPGAGGERRLAAYLVDDGAPGRVDGARRRLRAALPDHMVPAVFVRLPALPVNANGKLDLQALPAPAEEPAPEGVHVAPRTPLEELVAAAWRAVLGVERVGAHDDFFRLGGHSLLATQVVSRLRAATGVSLPLRVLFDAPTVAGIAEALAALRARPRTARPRLAPAAETTLTADPAR